MDINNKPDEATIVWNNYRQWWDDGETVPKDPPELTAKQQAIKKEIEEREKQEWEKEQKEKSLLKGFESSEKMTEKEFTTQPAFKPGDEVRIKKPQKPQRCGWNSEMDATIGMIGVIRVDGEEYNSYRVDFPDDYWYYDAENLELVTEQPTYLVTNIRGSSPKNSRIHRAVRQATVLAKRLKFKAVLSTWWHFTDVIRC